MLPLLYFVFNHIREQEEECIAEEFTNRVKGRMAAIIRESKELKLADFRKEIYTQNMSASDSENWKAFCRLSEFFPVAFPLNRYPHPMFSQFQSLS